MMYTIANNDKGAVEHDLKIPKLLYHAEYFAGKILNYVDPHLLMVNVCFSPEEGSEISGAQQKHQRFTSLSTRINMNLLNGYDIMKQVN